MSDITLTPYTNTVMVEGNSDAGVDFVDAWIGAILNVVDSGIIYVRAEDQLVIEKDAKEAGLTVDVEEGDRG